MPILNIFKTNRTIMKKILFALWLSLLILSSCGNRPPVDIINPEAEYLYFFWATCPHCQELNRIAEERDLYSQIAIEKREVYSNTENREIFADLVEELDAQSSGVPFVYDKVTWEIAVWVRPALELMTSRLGQNTVETTEIQINDEESTESTNSWATQ